MNLMDKPPVGLKIDRESKDPKRLALVARCACVVCERFGMVQTSPTQVHHVISGRYGTRKSPDSMAIPTCEGHHLGNFDTSKIAIHRNREAWVEAYGHDTSYQDDTEAAISMLD